MLGINRLRALMREVLALRAERGPYRFLVRKWSAISDIDIAARVLGTDIFKDEMVPLPLPIERLRSVVVLAPHQDDEIIGAGGSLLIAAEHGVKIDILYVTDGAAKDPAYAATPEDSARIRDREAREVCERLGATMHRLGISNRTPEPDLAHLDKISELLHDLKPQVVMAPWILDSPAKHRLVNHLLWLADQRNGLPDFEVWGYQVHNTLFPNGYIDITDVAEQKLELIRCFRSQLEHDRCYDHLAMGMAAWNARFIKSTEPKYIEVFLTLPSRELLNLVQSFYFNDLVGTYRGHNSVLSGAMAIHQAVTGKTLHRNGHHR